jgi:hypothetical protein
MGSNSLNLDGTSGCNATTPDAAPLRITSDIDIHVQVAMARWTPAALSTLVSKWRASGSFCYLLTVTTTGALKLWISTIGSDFPASSSSAIVGAIDGAIKWVRATRKQSNGNTKFYTSDDGTNWSALGIDQTLSAGTAIFSSTLANLEIGTDSIGVNDRSTARVLRVKLYNGYDGAGSCVYDADPSAAPLGVTRFTESSPSGLTVTLNGTAAIRGPSPIAPFMLLPGLL